MPGKIGDCLYGLHVARELCRLHNDTCDFYTSEYCRPVKRLFEYQSFVNKLVIPESYVIQRMDCGVQPWRMPINNNDYTALYHLGFRYVPDRPLHEFMASTIGLPGGIEIKYEYPKVDLPNEPYIILAPRGRTTYEPLFLEFIEKCPIRVIQAGGPGEAIGNDSGIVGIDMLETVSWIAGAQAFVGLMSSHLVLANGFPIHKIAPHDGRSWDMRHVVYSPYNHYPINPTANTILRMLDL